jgi:hypothetical protein
VQSDDGGLACSSDADCGVCAICESGICIGSCTPDAGVEDGGSSCLSEPTVCNGVRTDLSSDNDNCGACGVVCEAGSTCSCGVCAS